MSTSSDVKFMLLPVLQVDVWITDASVGLTALQMDDIGKQQLARKRSGLLEEEGRRSPENGEDVPEEELNGKGHLSPHPN